MLPMQTKRRRTIPAGWRTWAVWGTVMRGPGSGLVSTGGPADENAHAVRACHHANREASPVTLAGTALASAMYPLRSWPTALGRSVLPGRAAGWATSGSPTSAPSRASRGPTGSTRSARARAKTYRTVDRLQWYTEDRAPEIYLVLRSKRGANGGTWLQIRDPAPAQRLQGLGPARGDAADARAHHVARDRQAGAQGAPVPRRQRDLDVEHRHRRAEHADAQRPLLDPRAAHRLRQRRLRPARLRHRRLLAPVGVAGRRRHRHPRHESAQPDPGPPVPRVHPGAQRQDRPAGQAHAGGHAGRGSTTEDRSVRGSSGPRSDRVPGIRAGTRAG